MLNTRFPSRRIMRGIIRPLMFNCISSSKYVQGNFLQVETVMTPGTGLRCGFESHLDILCI